MKCSSMETRVPGPNWLVTMRVASDATPKTRLHGRYVSKKSYLNPLFSPIADTTFWLMPFPWAPGPGKERKRERGGRGEKRGGGKGGEEKKVFTCVDLTPPPPSKALSLCTQPQPHK